MAKPMQADTVALPRNIAARLLAFMGQGLTGNVTLHIKDGSIQGARLEEIVKKDIDKPASVG